MRIDELPAETLDKGWSRLVAVFGEPNSGTKDGWVWGVRAATRGWTEMEFHVAVKDAAVNCRYFPRPNDLVGRRPNRAPDPVDPDGGADLCRACKAPYQYAGYQQGTMRGKPGAVYGRLRCQCPKSDPGWETEAAQDWRPAENEHWMLTGGLLWGLAAH